MNQYFSNDFGDNPPILDLEKALQLEPSLLRDESFAPEVDRELLAALAHGELSERDARAAYRLIHSFKSWKDAWIDALTQTFNRASRSSRSP